MKIYLLYIYVVLFFAMGCSRGQTINKEDIKTVVPPNHSPFKHHLGINAFEWDFSEDDNAVISPAKMEIIRSFGLLRHYLDWIKLEAKAGQYTFNPTYDGGWNCDMIYQRCKAEGIDVLACIKNGPPWLMDTYPEKIRDNENVPAPYGLDRKDPATYTIQGKVGFQFAARYGRNKAVDPSLVKVGTERRWPNDVLNQVKTGLDYIRYVECDNERDKDWKGPQAHQNAEEYAANMSAFYDGHMGRLGKNVGVKRADPTMQVVMGGLSNPDVNYVIKMIEWCKKNRGFKQDGSVNLCFDVINYHLYNNDHTQGKEATAGRAPELSNAAKIADDFVSMSAKHAGGMEVWITESGYDLNPESPQRAIAIGNKVATITQADWMLRSAFLYVRHGLKRSVFYMLDDVDPKSTVQYSSSGFAADLKRRPVADYFYQTKKLIGDFHFLRNISSLPIVDVYGLKNKEIFVVYVADQIGKTKTFELDLGDASSANIYTLMPGGQEMSVKNVSVKNGKLSLMATETPVFVEKNK